MKRKGIIFKRERPEHRKKTSLDWMMQNPSKKADDFFK